MLTQAGLKELFKYNPHTGKFTRLKSVSSNTKPGDVVSCINASGYVVANIFQKKRYMHRMAWLYTYGELPACEIDHINGVRSDNRIENLRDVSRKDNQRNVCRPSNNTSGVTGVSWSKVANKWWAQIVINQKVVHIGLFTCKDKAIKARKEAEAKYGFHPNHGRG